MIIIELRRNFFENFSYGGRSGAEWWWEGGEEEEVVNLKFLLGKYFNLIELVCC